MLPVLVNHRMAWVEKDHSDRLVSTPCYVQSCQPADQAAQSHIQPGPERLQGWGIYKRLLPPALLVSAWIPSPTAGVPEHSWPSPLRPTRATSKPAQGVQCLSSHSSERPAGCRADLGRHQPPPVSWGCSPPAGQGPAHHSSTEPFTFSQSLCGKEQQEGAAPPLSYSETCLQAACARAPVSAQSPRSACSPLVPTPSPATMQPGGTYSYLSLPSAGAASDLPFVTLRGNKEGLRRMGKPSPTRSARCRLQPAAAVSWPRGAAICWRQRWVQENRHQEGWGLPDVLQPAQGDGGGSALPGKKQRLTGGWRGDVCHSHPRSGPLR